MKTNCDPIIVRTCERIRRHSTNIRKAQDALKKAIEAAVKDHVKLSELY